MFAYLNIILFFGKARAVRLLFEPFELVLRWIGEEISESNSVALVIEAYLNGSISYSRSPMISL